MKRTGGNQGIAFRNSPFETRNVMINDLKSTPMNSFFQLQKVKDNNSSRGMPSEENAESESLSSEEFEIKEVDQKNDKTVNSGLI